MIVIAAKQQHRIIFLDIGTGDILFLNFQSFHFHKNKQKGKDYNRNRDFYYVVTKYYQSNQLFRIFYSKDGGKSTEQNKIAFSFSFAWLVFSCYIYLRSSSEIFRQNHYNFKFWNSSSRNCYFFVVSQIGQSGFDGFSYYFLPIFRYFKFVANLVNKNHMTSVTQTKNKSYLTKR